MSVVANVSFDIIGKKYKDVWSSLFVEVGVGDAAANSMGMALDSSFASTPCANTISFFETAV